MLYIQSVIFNSISGFQYLRICNLTKKIAYGQKYMLQSKSNVTPVHNMQVHGKWRYSCTYSYPHYLTETVDSFTPRPLYPPPRKDPQVPLKSRLCGPQSQPEYSGEEAILLPLLGWSQFKAMKVYVAAYSLSGLWMGMAQNLVRTGPTVTIKLPCCQELNPDTLDAWPVLIKSEYSRVK